MNRFVKAAILTATAAAFTLGSFGAASARDWHHRHRNDALIGGAVGLATGLAIGSVIANQDRGPRYIDPPYDPAYDDDYAPVYRAPPPPPRRVYVEERRYYAPAPTPIRSVEPWTPQWERYCSYRYRSFDPRSGTYIGNDGRSHFCIAG